MNTPQQINAYRKNKSAIRTKHAAVYKLDKDGKLSFDHFIFLWPAKKKK